MNFILNIGLDNVPADLSYTNGVLNPLTTRRALQATQAARNHGFDIVRAKVVQSDTELTLVILAEDNGIGQDNRVDMLAVALKQDCIAIWSVDQQYGQLIGPKAAAWGEFNPEFFFMLDGTRLAQPTQLAA
jgi:hypothetical protein